MIKRALPLLALASFLASTNMTAHAKSEGELNVLERKGILPEKKARARVEIRGYPAGLTRGREKAEMLPFRRVTDTIRCSSEPPIKTAISKVRPRREGTE
jgi:hypothetical protein